LLPVRGGFLPYLIVAAECDHKGVVGLGSHHLGQEINRGTLLLGEYPFNRIAGIEEQTELHGKIVVPFELVEVRYRCLVVEHANIA
jgi:hypothetical protein